MRDNLNLMKESFSFNNEKEIWRVEEDFRKSEVWFGLVEFLI